MRRLALLAPFLLAGCAQTGDPDAAQSAAFARELTGYAAAAPQACVGTFPNQNLRVIDARTIAYGNGPTIYVNRLAGACPALSAYNTVIAEVHGGQYCRGDRVRGLEPGGIIPGPWCNLGDWTPYRRP
jgi:hypothetical protein